MLAVIIRLDNVLLNNSAA